MGGSVSCGLWLVCDQSGRAVSPVVYGGFVNSCGGKCLLWFVTSRGGKCILWFMVGLCTSHGGKCLLCFMVGL